MLPVGNSEQLMSVELRSIETPKVSVTGLVEGAALKIAAVFILGLGVFSSFQAVAQQSDSVAQAEFRLGIIERQSDLRGLKPERLREARILVNEAQLRTERLIPANDP